MYQKSLHPSISLFILAIAALLLLPATAQAQNVFTVDDTSDDGDDTPGDGICATSSGACTLRAAIEEANATTNSGGPDRIEFSTSTNAYFSPGSPLPDITDPVVIDGNTASGGLPYIRIDGAGAGSTGAHGLTISAGDSEIYGLQLVRFSGHGILLTGGGGNVIEDTHIGDFYSGENPAGYGNDGDGIRIEGGSTQNHIGNNNEDARNIIVGNGGSGIRISGGDPSAVNNVILGNYIGLSRDGERGLGNVNYGVHIDNGSTQNLIGGITAEARNIISANEQGGIYIADSGTDGNTAQGNYIGTDASGLEAVGNGSASVQYSGAIVIESGASSNIIGGLTDEARNVIAGNDGQGYDSGNGITISDPGTSNNEVLGNYIGVDATGLAVLENHGNGIQILNVATANYIGVDANGDVAGNVISGNRLVGINLTGASSDAVVQGNYIGIDADGTSAIPNGEQGILLAHGSSNNLIGGTADGAGNVISGNDDRGLTIDGVNTSDNTVQGNYIGTDAAGGAALANGSAGVQITGAPDNVIGGASADARNVISGNTHNGIEILGADATGNVVFGNYIGTDATGANPLGNGTNGVLLSYDNTGGAADNIVGGVAADEGNVVAYNGGAGVQVRNWIGGSYTTGNSIRGNSIYSNTGLGIDLYGGSENSTGITSNDPGDADDGANRLQNFPGVVEADYDEDADEVTITYRVPSDPNGSSSGAPAYPLEVDFYTADTAGEEGEVWIGSDTYVASDYTGGPDKQIVVTPAASMSRGDLVIATATDANGNTSEFTANAKPLPVELASFEAAYDGGAALLSWQTLSESGNAGFEIERAVGQESSWQAVGFVDGAGTTSEAQSYSFTDRELPFEADRVRYRLRQIDRDGQATTGPEVELALGVPEAFALHGNFPNPVRRQTAIRYELPEAAKVRLEVYDLLGRRVALLVDEEQQAGRKEVVFEAAELPSGVYLYRLSAGGTTETQQMVVVR